MNLSIPPMYAAVVSAVLAAVPLPAPSAPPTPGPAPERPCPVTEPDPAPAVPQQPSPPTHAPAERELGGEALASPELVVPRGAPEVPDELTAQTWLVADLDTGEVLGACGAHEYGVPASTLKLLLAAALLPELDPERTVEVVPEDLQFEPGSSAVGLVSGGEYTVELLWLGLLLNSGNDAANVLARVGGGEDGVEGGLRRMNAYAEQVGAYQTHAATPSGLDGPGQFTSAYDLALIARQLYDREDFREYLATERVEWPPQPPDDPQGYEIQNQDRLLTDYPGALGGKSGFTSLARHSYVGAAERDGRRLVATLLGAEAQPWRSWEQAATLLDWGFSVPPRWSVGRLVDPAQLAQQAGGPESDEPGEPDDVPAVVAGAESASATSAAETPAVVSDTRASGVSAGTVAVVGSLVLAGVVVVAVVLRQVHASRRTGGRVRGAG